MSVSEKRAGRLQRRAFSLGAALAGALVFSHAVASGLRVNPPAESVDPFDEYQELCAAGADSFECDILRGIIRHRTLEALQALQYTRDLRAVDEALLALTLDAEPEIQTEACRFLAYFADEDERIYPAMLPLLNSPYLATQRIVARALEASDDAGLSRVGRQWRQNHRDFLPTRLGLERLQGPAAVNMLLPAAYPGSAPYAPAESSRSLGWFTADPLDRVVGHFAAGLGSPALTPEEWQRRAMAASEATLALAMTPNGAMLKLQELAAKFEQTQDPALLLEMQEVSAQLDQDMGAVEQKMAGSLLQIDAPPEGSPASTRQSARFFVLEESPDRLDAVLVVYREQALGYTVIQVLWDEQVFGPTEVRPPDPPPGP